MEPSSSGFWGKNKRGCPGELAARLTWSQNRWLGSVTVVSELCVPAFRRVCLCQQENRGRRGSRPTRPPSPYLWRPNQRDPQILSILSRTLALWLCVTVFRTVLPCAKESVPFVT